MDRFAARAVAAEAERALSLYQFGCWPFHIEMHQ